MKKMTIMQYALAGISVLFMTTSAQSQSVPQLFKDNGKKQEIFNTIVNDSVLLTEFTNTMMKNPQSCKIMMKNAGMQRMMMNDTTMKKNMKNMKSMNMPADTTVYTCSMHPEIISKKPGKCPKCGMDLIKKSAVKKMDMGDMKMN